MNPKENLSYELIFSNFVLLNMGKLDGALSFHWLKCRKCFVFVFRHHRVYIVFTLCLHHVYIVFTSSLHRVYTVSFIRELKTTESDQWIELPDPQTEPSWIHGNGCGPHRVWVLLDHVDQVLRLLLSAVKWDGLTWAFTTAISLYQTYKAVEGVFTPLLLEE